MRAVHRSVSCSYRTLRDAVKGQDVLETMGILGLNHCRVVFSDAQAKGCLGRGALEHVRMSN